MNPLWRGQHDTVYNLKDYGSPDAIILIGKTQYCQLSMSENGRLHYYYFSFASTPFFSSKQPRNIRSFVWFSLLKSFYQLIKTAFLRQRKSHCMGAQCFHSQYSHFPKKGKITEKPFQTFKFTLKKHLSLSPPVN